MTGRSIYIWKCLDLELMCLACCYRSELDVMLKSETYAETLLKGLHELKERDVGCDLTIKSKVRFGCLFVRWVRGSVRLFCLPGRETPAPSTSLPD